MILKICIIAGLIFIYFFFTLFLLFVCFAIINHEKIVIIFTEILRKTVTFKNRQPQKRLLGCILPGCTEEKLLRNFYQIPKMIYCLNHENPGFLMI